MNGPISTLDRTDLKILDILQKDGRRSTFLPQVWEQLPTFEEFFSHLCHKGSFEVNCLEFHPQVFVYEVNKIK